MICNLYQVKTSLVLRPNLSHISELLRIYTTRHLHCTLRFSFFCSTMMTWSHSGPLFSPINIYKNTQLIGKILKVRGGAQGPVSQNCTSNPSNSSRVLELSQTLTNPCSQKNELNNPAVNTHFPPPTSLNHTSLYCISHLYHISPS
jgi:hypothetical protein